MFRNNFNPNPRFPSFEQSVRFPRPTRSYYQPDYSDHQIHNSHQNIRNFHLRDPFVYQRPRFFQKYNPLIVDEEISDQYKNEMVLVNPSETFDQPMNRMNPFNPNVRFRGKSSHLFFEHENNYRPRLYHENNEHKYVDQKKQEQLIPEHELFVETQNSQDLNFDNRNITDSKDHLNQNISNNGQIRFKNPILNHNNMNTKPFASKRNYYESTVNDVNIFPRARLNKKEYQFYKEHNQSHNVDQSVNLNRANQYNKEINYYEDYNFDNMLNGDNQSNENTLNLSVISEKNNYLETNIVKHESSSTIIPKTSRGKTLKRLKPLLVKSKLKNTDTNIDTKKKKVPTATLR